MYTSSLTLLAGIAAVAASPCPSGPGGHKPIKQIELGPRPYYLVDNMEASPLKDKLVSCSEKKMHTSSWSIGHRGGGTLQFPEESMESNLAGARMGAGFLECDVSFTDDQELVCRHSNCDLHTTTNIVTIPELNAKCTTPFKPAKDGKPAEAKCCTSDISLKEYKSLCAKMDGFNATATNPEDYLHGTPSWRTDLYATCATVMTLKEHIALVESLGLNHIPELKVPQVKMPFKGNYTMEKYAQQMIDTYKDAGVDTKNVFPQCFDYDVILHWLKHEPAFGRQSMYLDSTGDAPGTMAQATANLTNYAKDGIRFVAPSMSYLVESHDGQIVPSDYAKKAKEAGLKIVSWSLERSGPIAMVHKNGDSYYKTIQDIVTRDGDIMRYLDVLYRQVGVWALFSDWSATASYYANCFDIHLSKHRHDD